jgi:DNA polymerase-1
VSKHFTKIVVADFEYEAGDGELPGPLCMVWYVLNENLQHVQTGSMWREELRAAKRPPFDIGPNTLFVGYSAWAEMTCFKVLGWQFPIHIFDQHTAYLAATNVLLPYNPDEKRKRQAKGLSAACTAYGIAGWEMIDKGTIAKDIGEGRWRDHGRERVLEYCEEDVRASTLLLRAQLQCRLDECGRVRLPAADVEHVLHWANYSAKSVALIQARGISIDMPPWELMRDNRGAVIRELLRQFDPSHGDDYPIYTPEGEWSGARFERWLARTGVVAWPRLDSGALDLDSDAFRLMYHVPGVENLHALRDSIGFIAKARLPIGRDGRNRPSLFPFSAVTGRNAHARSPYNCHAGLRGFIRFPVDAIGAYLDWRTQEVGVAAAESGDAALMRDYAGGDVYHALARMCGLTADPDPMRWKHANPDVRHRMKGLQLGISYGMGVPSLARGLDRHPLIASEIIERHKRTYPRFWEWRAAKVQDAMLARRIESSFGWSMRISSSPNQRTLYNFPMQSGGAEMLRLAAWRLCEAGIIPVMLIHDGILLEETDRERIEHAKEIMRQAGRDTCDGFEIGVDVDQMLIGGARYVDKREMAKSMWATIMGALEDVGVLPKRQAS